MRFLRQLHLYLGCLFAPALILFAVSGAWQLFRWHDNKKDGSYTAPPALRMFSAIHMDSHLPGKSPRDYTPMRMFSLAAAVGLVITTGIGVVLAFRFSRQRLTPLLWLAAGVLIPAIILYCYG